MPVIIVTSDPRGVARPTHGPPVEPICRTPWVSDIYPCFSKFKIEQMNQRSKPSPKEPHTARMRYTSPVVTCLPVPRGPVPRSNMPKRMGAAAATAISEPRPLKVAIKHSPNYRNAVSGALQMCTSAAPGARRGGEVRDNIEVRRDLPSVKFFGGKMIMHMHKK